MEKIATSVKKLLLKLTVLTKNKIPFKVFDKLKENIDIKYVEKILL